MNVLFIAGYSGLSGANHSLVNLVKILEEKYNITPTVIIPRKGPVEELLTEKEITYQILTYYSWVVDINDKSFLTKAKWSIQNIINNYSESKVKKIIQNNNIDLVHINASTIGVGAKAAIKSNTKLVWHIREFLEKDLNKTFRASENSINLINFSDQIITISNSVNHFFKKVIDESKITTIYNGIDQNSYLNLNTSKFKKNKITLTIAGTLIPNKGQLEAVEAVGKLYDEGFDVKLQLAGNEGNQEYINEIKERIDILNLDKVVKFLGYIPNIEKVWESTDIALVCSKAEAFGRVTVEAMMSGSLVIGANTEGTAELIQNNKTGLTYEQGDSHDLANKIRYALENINNSRRIAANGRKYSLNNFTAINNAMKIHNLYQELLKHGKCK